MHWFVISRKNYSILFVINHLNSFFNSYFHITPAQRANLLIYEQKSREKTFRAMFRIRRVPKTKKTWHTHQQSAPRIPRFFCMTYLIQWHRAERDAHFVPLLLPQTSQKAILGTKPGLSGNR